MWQLSSDTFSLRLLPEYINAFVNIKMWKSDSPSNKCRFLGLSATGNSLGLSLIVTLCGANWIASRPRSELRGGKFYNDSSNKRSDETDIMMTISAESVGLARFTFHFKIGAHITDKSLQAVNCTTRTEKQNKTVLNSITQMKLTFKRTLQGSE